MVSAQQTNLLPKNAREMAPFLPKKYIGYMRPLMQYLSSYGCAIIMVYIYIYIYIYIYVYMYLILILFITVATSIFSAIGTYIVPVC